MTAAIAVTTACGRAVEVGADERDSPARLRARPPNRVGSPESATPGLRALASAPGALLHVPPGLAEGAPATLVVALHGAGSDARGGLTPLLPVADAHRLLLLATSSSGPTWDAIRGRWGPDVRELDQALTEVFDSFRFELGRLAISGFSDGASYALGVGLANADLFTHVIAFSPGFIPAGPRVGRPAIFVSHGRQDDVLPIDLTTRRVVPRLRDEGYRLRVHEFEGPHVVPAVVAEDAARWLVAPVSAVEPGPDE